MEEYILGGCKLLSGDLADLPRKCKVITKNCYIAEKGDSLKKMYGSSLTS